MKQPKLLLVSPVFYGYWKTIADSLSKQGYEVISHLYDVPANLAERVRNKALHDLPERFRPASFENLVTDKAIARLTQERPDIVLVVKGDQLGDAWWHSLQESGTRYATWMYDEFRRMRYSDKDFDLGLLGPIASYSPLDVQNLKGQGFEALEVPLAFDSAMQFTPQPNPDITFVGARYLGREQMLTQLQAAGIPVKAYGKQWSRHWWDVARTRNLKDSGVPAGRDLDRSAAYGLMAGSPATLNIHGDQDGFTMRTFEASGVGGLQIIDRTDVSRYYEVGTEVLAYESGDELIELCKRILADQQWAQQIREAGQKRTLAEHTFDHRIKTLEALWK